MKYTLLEIVQSILSSMDSDEVNSISDTVESYQVAMTCQDVFYDMAVDLGLEEHHGLITLGAATIAQPLMLAIPENVGRILWMKYNQQYSADTQPNYVDVEPAEFTDFLARQQGLFGYQTNVANTTFNGIDGTVYSYTYMTDKAPAFFTSPDNKNIIFDSIDTTSTGCNDQVLQNTKLMVAALLYPTFSLSDLFIPPIDAQQFPYYRNKCKVRCFNDFKQQVNQEAASEARRQKITVQRNREKSDPVPFIYRLKARYGRKGPMNSTVFTRAPVERN